MASSYSTDLKLELMVTGEKAGLWGDITNTNLNLLQQAIGGYQEVSIAGGAQTTTLVMSNAALSNARNAVIKLTGTITGNQIVTVPDGIEKTYIIANGTTGAFTVQFKTVSGTGITFGTTDKSTKEFFADGTNIVDTGTVSETGVQTLTNKTLTTPVINQINDTNGNEEIKFTATASAVNEFTVTNAATGNAPEISATGGDTNIDLKITPKGSGKINLDGITFPNADGTNGQVLSTNGSGALAFTTISSSPTQLIQSLPLGSGVSYTAGQTASIGSSGSIVALPTVNTFGTARVNSNSTAYTAISTDGSRVIKCSMAANVMTVSGIAISNSATPTNGTVNVTSTVGYPAPNGSAQFSYVVALGPTSFYLTITAFGAYYDEYGSSNYRRDQSFIVVVDSDGNCTKGNEVSSDRYGSNANPSLQIAKAFNTLVLFRQTSNAQATVNNMHVISSTSTITVTSNANVEFFINCNGINSWLTTSNKLILASGNTLRISDYVASPASIGTKTDTTVFGDYLSGGDFVKMCNLTDNSPEYVLSTYTDTSAVSKYVTFSVNQTTGALTQVATGALSVINSNAPSSMTFRDKDRFIGTNSSFSFTNGVANSPSFNAPYTLGTMRYNSADLYYSFGTAATGYPQNQGYTVVAYATTSFNYIGIVKTTDSTSPIDIVTDGVVGGFTGLTAGTLYYTSSPADGTVTTSSASGILVGKAVSATEILIIRGTN